MTIFQTEMPDRIDEEVTFRKLEVLLAYMETENLAKTAEALDVSTVSVHRALHSLEQGMRCVLFRREGRNLRPTEAAHTLADVEKEVMALMSDGIRSTRETAGYSSDRLKLGSIYSLTTNTVPGVVVDIKLRRPALQVELVLGSNAELLEKLKHGAIDAALMSVPEAEPEVDTFVVRRPLHIVQRSRVKSRRTHIPRYQSQNLLRLVALGQLTQPTREWPISRVEFTDPARPQLDFAHIAHPCQIVKRLHFRPGRNDDGSIRTTVRNACDIGLVRPFKL
jgi:DNA-binding transcriptional LysR family regulator